MPELPRQRCFEAYRSVEPSAPDFDVWWGCVRYADLRLLFTGIQIAGPRLDPKSVDRGFHAIPALGSQDPQSPARYFEPGDYTCTKDAIAQWWDVTADAPYEAGPHPPRGCYRIPLAGRRYMPGQWPAGDVRAQQNPDDVCNGYDAFAPL